MFVPFMPPIAHMAAFPRYQMLGVHVRKLHNASRSWVSHMPLVHLRGRHGVRCGWQIHDVLQRVWSLLTKPDLSMPNQDTAIAAEYTVDPHAYIKKARASVVAPGAGESREYHHTARSLPPPHSSCQQVSSTSVIITILKIAGLYVITRSHIMQWAVRPPVATTTLLLTTITNHDRHPVRHMSRAGGDSTDSAANRDYAKWPSSPSRGAT